MSAGLDERPSGNEPPCVSVLMPVHNEARFIERSLGAVLAQDYPGERLEVLVLDGMSDDGTRDVASRLLAGRPGVRRRFPVQFLCAAFPGFR